MNNFKIDEIERILNYPAELDDAEIPQQVFDVIYSLGRDCESEEECRYSYHILLDLCSRKSKRVRAYCILAMSLMGVMNHGSVLDKSEIISIIKNELKNTDDWSRKTILTAVEDFNSLLHWDIVC